MTEENKNTGIKGRLVIFRHGQTPYNKAHLMTGLTEVPLTDLGREQAAEAGRAIAAIRFDHVYSSTLSRAFNTAALALQAAGSQEHLRRPDGSFAIQQHEDIVEIDVGDFAGRCHRTDPEILAWQRDFHRPLPNGESDAQATARVQKFFDTEIMPRLEKGETVLVVCHAGIVRVFDFVLGLAEPPKQGHKMGDMIKRRAVPNATPVLYDFVDGKLVGETQLTNGANQNAPAAKPPKFG